MSYRKGRILVDFIPKGIIDTSVEKRQISKVELLRVIEDNLSDYDELIYVPENPDNFHTDFILTPILKKVINGDSDPVVLMKMFATEDKSIRLVYSERDGNFWLYSFYHFEKGKPTYTNHILHKERLYYNGISENEVAGRFWRIAEQSGQVVKFGKLPDMLKQFGIDIYLASDPEVKYTGE